MFKVQKTLEVAISHHLNLPYESSCKRSHGHNLLITVYCVSEVLNSEGMVIDFKKIKRIVHDQLDHNNLNEIEGLGFEFASFDSSKQLQIENKRIEKNPTAERIAYWICMQIDSCYRVDVQESIGNVATYEVP